MYFFKAYIRGSEQSLRSFPQNLFALKEKSSGEPKGESQGCSFKQPLNMRRLPFFRVFVTKGDLQFTYAQRATRISWSCHLQNLLLFFGRCQRDALHCWLPPDPPQQHHGEIWTVPKPKNRLEIFHCQSSSPKSTRCLWFFLIHMIFTWNIPGNTMRSTRSAMFFIGLPLMECIRIHGTCWPLHSQKLTLTLESQES